MTFTEPGTGVVSRAEIEAFVARLVAAYQPERVILFGSHARGAANSDSDVDLLIVLPLEGRPSRLATDMKLALRPNFPIDLVLRSPAEYASASGLNDSPDWILLQGIRTGMTLHEAKH